MTMPARSADGILRTQPVETPRALTHGNGHATSDAAVEDGQEYDRWDVWSRGVSLALAELTREVFARITPLTKRVHELELKCAELKGALDAVRKGTPNGALNPRGAFDSLEVYSALDVVMLNGSSWVAIKDNPGSLPGSGWRLLASAGARGQRGPAGRQGERGAAAPTWKGVSFDLKNRCFWTRMSDGSEGPQISLDFICAGVDVDCERYAINFKMLDGSEIKFSLRPLFERFFHELEADLQRPRRP
jgi:hypothetical protein